MAKSPPDVSRAARQDSAMRFPLLQPGPRATSAELDATNRSVADSARRRFRQSEDAGSGPYMGGVKHNVNGDDQ